MAAADCTLTVGEAGVAQGLQDQLAALDAQDAEAVANEQTAQMLGDTAAQDQLASAQQTALDGYNNGVAQAYVAYQTSDYSDQTAVATTLNSTLSIPWSQFEQQEAGADQNWWSSEQSGYLAWFSQTQSAGDAYQDAVNVQSTTETATQAAADAAQTNQSAQAGLTQTLAQSAAADAQTQALALAQQSYLDATALVDRNQAVATAQGSSGSFSSQLAAAGQQYVTQATAAGDAYNTAAAAGDLAYATATSQIDDAYATATDSAQDTSTDAQTADSGTLQTALADDQAGYDENQQTTYASALSGLETSDPSPWAQLSAAQASAEETATDTIDSAQATGTIAQVTAADTQTDAQAGADATQDIAGVTAQGQQAIADANAEVAQAAADTAADAGATGFASAAGQLPAQYVDWVFGSPAAPSTPAAYASPQPDAEYATIVNREEGTPYSAFSPGFPNAGDWAPGGQWAWYGSLAQYLGVTAAPTYQSPMARPALQQHTIRTYPAAETPGGGLSQFSSGENGTVPFSPPATAASAASSLSQTVSQTDPGLTRSPAASVALPANLVSTVDSTAMQGVAAIQFSQFSAIAPMAAAQFSATASTYSTWTPTAASATTAAARFGDPVQSLAACSAAVTGATDSLSDVEQSLAGSSLVVNTAASQSTSLVATSNGSAAATTVTTAGSASGSLAGSDDHGFALTEAEGGSSTGGAQAAGQGPANGPQNAQASTAPSSGQMQLAQAPAPTGPERNDGGFHVQRGHDAGGLGDMWGTANTAAEVSGAFLNKFVVDFYRGLGDWIVNTYKSADALSRQVQEHGFFTVSVQIGGQTWTAICTPDMWGPQASQQFLKVMAGTDNRAKYEALTALGMTFFIPGPEAVIGRALDGLGALAKAGKLGARLAEATRAGEKITQTGARELLAVSREEKVLMLTKDGKIVEKTVGELTSAEQAELVEQIVDTTAKASGSGSRGGRATALSGRSAEERVSEATGIPLNRGAGRDTVLGSGPGGYRIPDMRVFGPNASIALRGSIIEVKDAERFYYRPQVRDLVNWAHDHGYIVEIFTNAAAPTRGKVAEWIKQGIVVFHPIP